LGVSTAANSNLLDTRKADLEVLGPTARAG
jgi:hypothetical protein